LQPIPKQQSWNPEITDFVNFAKFPQKTELLEKFKLLDKRGFELTEVRKKYSCPLANPHS